MNSKTPTKLEHIEKMETMLTILIDQALVLENYAKEHREDLNELRSQLTQLRIVQKMQPTKE